MDKCQDLLKTIQEESKKRGLPTFLEREFSVLNGDSTAKNSYKIRLLQWNVLAQALSKYKDNFVLCPDSALEWDSRKLRILEGILRYHPDVICTEEVDHFEYLNSHLSSIGYTGIFNPKPDSPCLYCKNSLGPDGCALFYRKDRLKLLHSDKVGIKDAEGQLTNQVAIYCLFEIVGEDSDSDSQKNKFSVFVTHLKAKSGFEELRYQQGEFILDYLNKNALQWPIIVCGDFNADQSEAVYQSFSTSDIGLYSAYTKLSINSEEPAYTTWKVRCSADGPAETCRTIDYIWCSKDSIEITSLLDLPKEEDVGKDRLPSLSYPSDHLSLVCDFKLV